mgnify:CR=1 FL=1
MERTDRGPVDLAASRRAVSVPRSSLVALAALRTPGLRSVVVVAAVALALRRTAMPASPWSPAVQRQPEGPLELMEAPVLETAPAQPDSVVAVAAAGMVEVLDLERTER